MGGFFARRGLRLLAAARRPRRPGRILLAPSGAPRRVVGHLLRGRDGAGRCRTHVAARGEPLLRSMAGWRSAHHPRPFDRDVMSCRRTPIAGVRVGSLGPGAAWSVRCGLRGPAIGRPGSGCTAREPTHLPRTASAGRSGGRPEGGDPGHRSAIRMTTTSAQPALVWRSSSLRADGHGSGSHRARESCGAGRGSCTAGRRDGCALARRCVAPAYCVRGRAMYAVGASPGGVCSAGLAPRPVDAISSDARRPWPVVWSPPRAPLSDDALLHGRVVRD